MKKDASALKKGNYFLYEGEPYIVQSNDHSKSGKHGHAKNRVGALSLFSKKKKSFAFLATDALDIPEIDKRQGQLIDINLTNQTAMVMDVNTNETIDVDFPLEDDTVSLEKLQELANNPEELSSTSVEFWTVIGKNFITRVMTAK
jgi:translation initiation factor 5A